MKAPTKIHRVGQSSIVEPVYAYSRINPVAAALAEASTKGRAAPVFGMTKDQRDAPLPLKEALQSGFLSRRSPAVTQRLIGTRRVRLNWLEPGPDGSLVPRKAGK